MRKLLPILIAVLALVGGLAAGWFLNPGASAPAAAAGEHGGEAAGGEGHGAAATDPHAAPAPDAHAAPPSEAHAPADAHAATDAHAAAADDGHGGSAPLVPGGKEYVKLNNQFIVPLIQGGRVGAMVILSISLEMAAGSKEKVYAVEPKLRDTFLRVMFDHANAGGFEGTYTDRAKLDVLRATLAEVARPMLGDSLSEVLIEDIVRQDS